MNKSSLKTSKTNKPKKKEINIHVLCLKLHVKKTLRFSLFFMLNNAR